MKLAFSGIAALALTVSALPAQAAVTEVFPSNTSWKAKDLSGGGSAKITGTAQRSGDGSLELKGDKARFLMGGTNFLSSPITSIGKMSSIESLTFDWMIAGDSVSKLSPDYTPALRLYIKSGSAVKELIWEGAYNGTYGNTDLGTWYTSGADDKFYIGAGNENAGKSIADWANMYGNYDIIGISVGVGSSVGAGYHAFADNVTLTSTGGGVTTWNFNLTASPIAAVPEPATWAMMIAGFGMVGGTMRRRRAKTAAALA